MFSKHLIFGFSIYVLENGNSLKYIILSGWDLTWDEAGWKQQRT